MAPSIPQPFGPVYQRINTLPSNDTSLLTSSSHGQAEGTIGLDFGTTYSGAAYTWSNKADKVKVITCFGSDSYSNSDEEKAPTSCPSASQPSRMGIRLPFTKSSPLLWRISHLASHPTPESIPGYISKDRNNPAYDITLSWVTSDDLALTLSRLRMGKPTRTL